MHTLKHNHENISCTNVNLFKITVDSVLQFTSNGKHIKEQSN